MTASEILKNAKVAVAPETFSLIAMRQADWQRLLSEPELSPRMSTPFMILFDRHEVTMLLDEIDFETVRRGLRDAKVERGFRLLTFDVELGLELVGFMAAVTAILAGAGIPILALSAFSRDHLLIRQGHLASALKALGPHVGELC